MFKLKFKIYWRVVLTVSCPGGNHRLLWHEESLLSSDKITKNLYPLFHLNLWERNTVWASEARSWSGWWGRDSNSLGSRRLGQDHEAGEAAVDPSDLALLLVTSLHRTGGPFLVNNPSASEHRERIGDLHRGRGHGVGGDSEILR